MKIIKTKLKDGTNGYECIIGDKKLVITTDFGPRILHLSTGNSGNILFVDEKKELFKNDWFIYGGHRLWVAPESKDVYDADNNACEVTAGDNDKLEISSYNDTTKLKKTITIAEKNNDFFIRHNLENKGDVLVNGAAWALTCVLPQGTVFFPWGTTGSWQMKKIIYWKEWMGHTTNLKSSQFIEGDDLFLIKPTGEEGKVGTGGFEGFIGVTAENYTFIKKFQRVAADNYPDDNCAIECYTCDKFIELETLSPMQVIVPGGSICHEEHWLLCSEQIDPEDGDRVRGVL
jgi:hypothetical protein